MRTVSLFESNLLRILHCFLGHASVSQVLPAIVRPLPRPKCLSRDAVELVQNSLASGTTMLLTRRGAWVAQRHLRVDQTREGSLWERTNPEELGLEFTPASLDFLIWLTESDATKETAVWVRKNKQPLSVGDQTLLYLAARALRDTSLVTHWYQSDVFRTNGLIALTLPEQFAEAKVIPTPDFAPWMSGTGGCVLEAMQDELSRIWVKLERNKCKVSRVDFMRRLGEVQETVLNQLFDAVEQNGRRDLCRFLLEAASRLLTAKSHRDQWITCLDTTNLRLAERTEVYKSASAFLRASRRLRQWHTASLGVGYFDEGYAESQLWKSLWELSATTEAINHADRIVKELEF